MATIDCTITQRTDAYKVYIEYSYSQNTSKNTSTVTAALKLKQLTDNIDFDTGSAVTVSFVMNGTTYSKTARINIDDKGNAGTVFTLVSGSQTITHSNDGTKSINFSCSNTSSLLNCGGWGPGNITLSKKTVVLKTIPRAASIDKITNASGNSIRSIDAGQDILVYYTPASKSYYHRIRCYVNSKYVYSVNLNKGNPPSSLSQTSETITVQPEWFPSTESGSLEIRLYTCSDSNFATIIGNKTKTITINISDTENYQPVASLTISPIPNHNLGTGDFLIQGKSSISVQANAIIKGGTSFSSISVSGNGISLRTNAANDLPLEREIKVNASGNLEYTATVTDMRSRSNKATSSVFVHPYSPPTYSLFSVVRCRNDVKNTPDFAGKYALCKITCNAHSLIPASEELNTRGAIVYYRLAGNTEWSVFAEHTPTNTLSGEIVLVNTKITFDESSTYEFKASISDAFTTTETSTTKIVSVGRPFNIARNNNGVAIGKMSSVNDTPNENLFEVGWPTVFDQAPKFTEVVIPTAGQNLDTYTQGGVFWFAENELYSNTPGGSGWLVVTPYDENICKQVWMQKTSADNQIWIRTLIDGVWSTWKCIKAQEDTGWVALTLESGVTAYNCGGISTPSYRRIGNHVYIEGGITVTPGTNKVNIATLPTGCRPKNTIHFFTPCQGLRIARFNITSTGLIGVEWALNIEDSTYCESSIWMTLKADFIIT